MGKFVHLEHHQCVAMLRQNIAAPLVIPATLFTTRHTGNGQPVVKKPDAFPMLAFMILYHQVQIRIEAVDWQ